MSRPQSLAEALRLIVHQVEEARAGRSSIQSERMTHALARCRELAATELEGAELYGSTPLTLRERGLVSSLLGGARLAPMDAALARMLELRGLVVIGHDGTSDIGFTTVRGKALLEGGRSAA